MKLDSKESQGLWTDWVRRDDRAWLHKLQHQHWNPTYCEQSLNPLLHSILQGISGDDSSSHTGWARPHELRLRSLNLLTWMRDSGEWDRIFDSWNNNRSGPWSMNFVVHRSAWRFHTSKYSDRNDEYHSRDVLGQTQFWMDSLIGEVSGSLSQAFDGLLHQLPQKNRLVYQLYLEGLKPEEISEVLLIPLSVIFESIEECKSLLMLWMSGEEEAS